MKSVILTDLYAIFIGIHKEIVAITSRHAILITLVFSSIDQCGAN